MTRLFVIPFLFFVTMASAQKRYDYAAIGVNPFSPAESMSSIGPCISYRFSSRLELWIEASYIFHNLYKINDWQNLKGYRFIFQPRYYIGSKRGFFITPEFRLKHYTYNTSAQLINDNTNDTLDNYYHKASQYLYGGAVVIGKQFNLSKQKNLFLEATVGLGGKYRTIQRRNIPDGYSYKITTGGFGLAPHYEWDKDGTPYFPLGLRFVWHFTNK